MDWDPLTFPSDDVFDELLGTEHDGEAPFQAIVLPLQELVFFPQMVSPLFLEQESAKQALEAAVQADLPLVGVVQRDPQQLEDPQAEDLYTVGTDLVVVRYIHLPDETLSAIVQGIGRIKILEYTQYEPYLVAKVQPLFEWTDDSTLEEALMRAVLAMFEEVISLNESLPEEAYVYAMNESSSGALADMVAQIITLDVAQRQELLETLDVNHRLQLISTYLGHELEVLELEDRIHTTVQQEVDKTQREYFLREQLRVIQHELGESDSFTRDVARLEEDFAAGEFPDYVRERASEELKRLAMMPAMAPESGILHTYLDWLLNLPWHTATTDNLDLGHAEQVLESRHYGLPKAKERILEYIAVRKMAPEKSHSTILCFVGPPGTGKTSLGRSIAEALGREFVRVSLGGVRDEAEIRGHRRTYIGALPGRIIQTMRRAGTVNPVFMLDEVDKLGQDFRGNPASALLEVLDPEQNYAFSDHYLEIPYDLSQVLFITTANIMDTIPPALEDRMEVIEFPGYTEDEKIEIARRFLIPRQIELNGLEGTPLHFQKKSLHTLIRQYTYEAGVRNLEREIGSLCRKATRRLAEDKRPLATVTPKTLTRYLGAPQHIDDPLEKQHLVGLAMGLAWTPNGGDLLPVEVALLPGKGGFMLTGRLGDVLQESAQAAFTYLRARGPEYGISPEQFDKTDIHIHMPEGAISKDGPSAGLTIAVALFSAFTQRPVYRDVAMTGEITLRGRVLTVGGLKEKLLAAHRAKVQRVFLPARNQKDLPEIPKTILKPLDLVWVNDVDTVLREALLPPEAA